MIHIIILSLQIKNLRVCILCVFSRFLLGSFSSDTGCPPVAPYAVGGFPAGMPTLFATSTANALGTYLALSARFGPRRLGSCRRPGLRRTFPSYGPRCSSRRRLRPRRSRTRPPSRPLSRCSHRGEVTGSRTGFPLANGDQLLSRTAAPAPPMPREEARPEAGPPPVLHPWPRRPALTMRAVRHRGKAWTGGTATSLLVRERRRQTTRASLHPWLRRPALTMRTVVPRGKARAGGANTPLLAREWRQQRPRLSAHPCLRRPALTMRTVVHRGIARTGGTITPLPVREQHTQPLHLSLPRGPPWPAPVLQVGMRTRAGRAVPRICPARGRRSKG